MGVTKAHVVAGAMVKRFKRMVESYDGPPEGLRKHLLTRLGELDGKVDELLCELSDEIL